MIGGRILISLITFQTKKIFLPSKRNFNFLYTHYNKPWIKQFVAKGHTSSPHTLTFTHAESDFRRALLQFQMSSNEKVTKILRNSPKQDLIEMLGRIQLLNLSLRN